MKKKYITPVCTTISVCTTQLLNGSQTPPDKTNEFADDQGKIRVGTRLWGAGNAD